jgi:hypothetical protein
MSIGGSAYAILVGDDGQIIQREVEVKLAIVPQEVLDAGTKTHPDAKIGEASIITRGDKMFYQLEMHIGKDEHDVEISADGKVLGDSIAKPEAADANEKKDEGEKKDRLILRTPESEVHRRPGSSVYLRLRRHFVVEEFTLLPTRFAR